MSLQLRLHATFTFTVCRSYVHFVSSLSLLPPKLILCCQERLVLFSFIRCSFPPFPFCLASKAYCVLSGATSFIFCHKMFIPSLSVWPSKLILCCQERLVFLSVIRCSFPPFPYCLAYKFYSVLVGATAFTFCHMMFIYSLPLLSCLQSLFWVVRSE